MVIEIH